MSERTIIEIGGPERTDFLQGLVSNDLAGADGGLVHSALLTPQGKYLADFFLHETGERILLDVASDLAPDLLKRLTMYKLRRAVTIAASDLKVARGTGPAPDGALADPRHPDMGWRHYGNRDGDDGSDWDAIRVDHVIPETGIELIPNETFILEAGLDRLNGVDFRKGCYVGQEVTARMRHKTELKKGLVQVAVDGEAPVGTEILAGDKPAGQLFTQSGGRAIAHLRFDRARGPMTAGNATVTWDGTRPG